MEIMEITEIMEIMEIMELNNGSQYFFRYKNDSNKYFTAILVDILRNYIPTVRVIYRFEKNIINLHPKSMYAISLDLLKDIVNLEDLLLKFKKCTKKDETNISHLPIDIIQYILTF